MKIKRLYNKDFNKILCPEIGSKIVSARKQCGLSQKELGDMLGLSGIAISLLETNKRQVSAVRLWQISQITNLPITYFL